jgi:hypothetical protein
MFETALDADVAGLHILQVLNATFNPDVGGHGMNCRHVKRGGQADRLRKFRDAGIDHSVKRLAPPVTGWNAKPWYGAGAIHELRCFLLERHAVHQIGSALLGRQARILIRQIRRLLSDSRGRKQ